MNNLSVCTDEYLYEVTKDKGNLQAIADNLQRGFTDCMNYERAAIALCTVQPTVSLHSYIDGNTTDEWVRSRVKGQDENADHRLLCPVADDETIRRVFDVKDVRNKKEGITIYPDLDSEKPPIWHENLAPHVKSWIAIPLFWNNEPIGLITLDDREPNKFAKVNVEDLKKYAEKSASTIHNALLERNLEILQKTMEEIGNLYDTEEILETAAKKIKDSLDCRRCRIFRRQENSITLQPWVNDSRICDDKTLSFEGGEGIAGWVSRHKKSRSVPLIITDSDIGNIERRAIGFKYIAGRVPFFNSMLAVPIIADNIVIGVICVDDKDAYKFSRYDLKLVELIASQIGAVIERTRAFNLVGSTLPQINCSGKIKEIMNVVLETVAKMTNSKYATIDLVKRDQGKPEIMSVYNYPEGFKPPNTRMNSPCPKQQEKSLVKKVIDKRDIEIYEEGENQDLLNPEMRKLGINATVGSPLLYDGDVIAVLSISAVKSKFSKIEKETLRIFSAQAAYVIRMSQNATNQENLINCISKISKIAASESEQREKEIFEAIVQSVRIIMNPPPIFCHLGLVKEKEDDITIEYKATYPPEDLNDVKIKGETPINKSLANNQPIGITGCAIMSKKTIRIDDVENIEDPELNKHYIPLGKGTHSELAVPIVDEFENKAVGVINIEHKNLNAFSVSHQLMIEAFSDQVALTIKGQELEKSRKLRHKQFDNLIDTAHKLMATTSEDFEYIAQDQLERTCKFIGSTEAILIWWEGKDEGKIDDTKHSERNHDKTNDGSKVIKKIANTSCAQEKIHIREYGLSYKVSKREKKEAEYIDNIHDKNRKDLNPKLRARSDIKSAACLPLDIETHTVGVIWFHFKDKLPEKDEDRKILAEYAFRYGLAVNNHLNRKRASELERQNLEWERLSEGLDKKFRTDYRHVRLQQILMFAVSAIIGTLAAYAIVISIDQSLSDLDEFGRKITAVAGGLGMLISTLIYTRADKANVRADQYHTEQLKFRQLSFLCNLARSLPESESQSTLKQKCIHAVTEHWFLQKESSANREEQSRKQSGWRKRLLGLHSDST